MSYNSLLFFFFFWFVVEQVHDQISYFFFDFISKAEPVFARIDKLFIYIDRIKVLNSLCCYFAIPGQPEIILTKHISTTHVLLYSVYDVACLNTPVFWEDSIRLEDGVSIGQGVLYFPSASLSLILKHNFVTVTRVKVMQ